MVILCANTERPSNVLSLSPHEIQFSAKTSRQEPSSLFLSPSLWAITARNKMLPNESSTILVLKCKRNPWKMIRKNSNHYQRFTLGKFSYQTYLENFSPFRMKMELWAFDPRSSSTPLKLQTATCKYKVRNVQCCILSLNCKVEVGVAGGRYLLFRIAQARQLSKGTRKKIFKNPVNHRWNKGLWLIHVSSSNFV